MQKVMVRRQLANRNVELIQGDVLSNDRGKLRVKLPGMLRPVAVNAEDTMSVSRGIQQLSTGRVVRQFPASRSALGNRFV